MIGKVEDILIADGSGSKMRSMSSVLLEPGKGIVGDRYYNKTGTFSKTLTEEGDFEVTLIEQEKISAFNEATGLEYRPEDFRRNIVTTGISLNDLEGQSFYVGDVKLHCTRLCEPCAYLANILGKSIMEHMLHKAGLRAVILEGGEIAAGAVISSNQ